MKNKWIMLLAIPAFLLAGLLAGYAYQHFSNSESISFTEGDFSELFLEQQSEIVVYTLPDCPFCHQLKQFMEDNSVDFEERAVLENPEYLAQVRSLGSERAPVILTRRFKIEGFDKRRVSEIFQDHNYLTN